MSRARIVAASAVACFLATTALAPAHASPGPTTPGGGVKAVLVSSWGDCSSKNLLWEQLNEEWPTLGTVPIHVDFADRPLCGNHFNLADLEASGANTVILSDPAGGQFELTPHEIAALATYLQEGHDLIGTYVTFSYTGIDNTALAPLFGFAEGQTWGLVKGPALSYTLRPHKLRAKRLIRDLPNPYVSSGYDSSQAPGTGGRWLKSSLAGATIVGRTPLKHAVITVYRAEKYRAIYIANMPEYHGGPDDLQFLYNAIIYPKLGT